MVIGSLYVRFFIKKIKLFMFKLFFTITYITSTESLTIIYYLLYN